MKNIHTILSEIGISIPDDKKADFDKAVAENYKTSAEFEKKVNRLSDDLEAEKKRADTAVETLKGFEGKDFDAITRERDDWKKKHDNLEASHKKEQEEREFSAALEAAITESKGKNAKAITALQDIEKLRSSKNQQADIKAALVNGDLAGYGTDVLSTEPPANNNPCLYCFLSYTYQFLLFELKQLHIRQKSLLP